MWLFYVGMILFLFWPLLIGVALLMMKFLTKRNVFTRLAIGAAVLNAVWIVFLRLSTR